MRPKEQGVENRIIAKYLGISHKSFKQFKDTILSNGDQRLCTIRDDLDEEFSYNQIRWVALSKNLTYEH